MVIPPSLELIAVLETINGFRKSDNLQSLYGVPAFLNRDVCMGFILYLKTRSLVTFHSNVLTLGNDGNSDSLFHFLVQINVFRILYLISVFCI